MLPSLFVAALAVGLNCRQTPAVPAPPRVLVYTLSAGFEHDVVRRAADGSPSLVERELVAWGRDDGRFEAVVSREAAQFEAAALAQYAGVLLYTTGELPWSEAQRSAFFEFIDRGGALIGVHCATDTFYKLPAFGPLIGAHFDGHPWHEKVRVLVEDARHPATRHLAPSFEITDEIYQFKSPYERRRLQVLMKLDTSSLDMQRAGIQRTDGDFALAWTREQHKGRVFYTALGHRPEVWADARFKEHLIGGLLWALRALPDAQRTSEDEYREHARATPGDPARGFQVFRRESGPMCVRCHVVNGTGADVGPDLSDVGKRRTREELLTQVLEPSREIEERYKSTSLELADGRLVFGMLKSETDTSVDIVDTNAVRTSVAKKDIAARTTSNVSIMPTGLASLVTKDEFADLIAYLATLKMAPAK